GPGAATALALPVGTSASSLALGARQETDTHGGWIIDSAGVYLFTGSGGRRVGPGFSTDVIPAGQCL
ncbi:MAG TPA: hypothetical protein VET65_12970, partial [Candidatus Limnocylindrales bacterium]|nr:hypothetical protein [Candidatus Limnocylindrales bacterium]